MSKVAPSIYDNAFWVDEADLALLKRASRKAISSDFDAELTVVELARLIAICGDFQ